MTQPKAPAPLHPLGALLFAALAWLSPAELRAQAALELGSPFVDDMILQAKAKLGVTSVVISHDIASAFHIADQILFIFEGEIVARGQQREMLACEHPFVQKFFETWREKNA